MKPILILLFLSLCNAQVVSITGTVIHGQTGAPLEAVNVTWGDQGTATDAQGRFSMTGNPHDTLVVSHIGFIPQQLAVAQETFTIRLQPKILQSAPITVEAVRAVEGVTPVTFSTLTPDEIKRRYTVQDVPMVLASEPGIYAYSESGNGTGYSYVSIRGFDQSRISVMVDNVPLNDNESFQVYWVDHGDILAQAEDVQIQRGLGMGIIGSSAFGGTINLRTGVQSPVEKTTLSLGGGSFATTKTRLQYTSGNRWGPAHALGVRISQVESAGYREFHDSFQRTGFVGYDWTGDRWSHQLRAIVGKEITHLSWDGIPSEDINDRTLRRVGYRAYTDDFLQKILSLNSTVKVHPNLWVRSTLYQVNGQGYYQVRKSGVDFYSYNLDLNDSYPDSIELGLTTDVTRRKWIVNRYSGWNPTLTWMGARLRLDAGLEYRSYIGDHFGEVSDFSDDSLRVRFGNDWYRYYQYVGRKTLLNAFVQFGVQPLPRLWIFASGQNQHIRWTLDQESIGHAPGYALETTWSFFNPRIGLSYRLSDRQRFFVNFGSSYKEPADNQIIEADDVFAAPKDRVAPEMISSREIGYQLHSGGFIGKINAYVIDFKNEQLKEIDINQEGEYDYYSAPKTRHEGVELEVSWLVTSKILLTGNGTWAQFRYQSGDYQGNRIPNTPEILGNGTVIFRPRSGMETSLTVRYVGGQTLDNDALATNPSYVVVDINGRFSRGPVTVAFSLNNVLDALYTTFGYAYEWDGLHAVYWPGATRNGFLELSVTI